MEEQDVAPTVVLAPPTEKKIRMKSPSPGFRGRSQTPIRGRSMTPLMRFREKSATPMDPMTWRSITPFIQREEVEKTPFEIGSNILLNLASYKAIIDKALVMDISAEEEPLAKYIISEHSVIDRAAVMDISNVEIIYVEDDFVEECDELSDASSVRESESRESSVMDERPSEEREDKPEEEEVSDKKKKKEKKVKKAPKKKEKKEKEPSPPKLKLDLGGPPPPKVNKAKLFEQQQKAAAEAPLNKPPPKKSGKLAGALAAMQQQEAAAKEAELQRQQIEEKMKQMKEEQASKQQNGDQEEDEGEGDAEERGSQMDSEYRSRSGSGSRSGSEYAGSNADEQEDEENNEEAEGEEDGEGSGAETESSVENFTRPDNDYGEWDKYDDQQGVIRSKYERKKHKKMSERERDIEWQKAREAARYPRIHAHLKDCAIEEGHSIKLTCTVSGPELNIKWLKDGHPLEKSPKYRILVNEGIVSLEILRTLPSDSGEYTCALSNNNGDASTTAIVTIYDVIKDDPTPPTFTLVRDYYHLNEDVLGIEVHCTGTPRPKITWIRDMVEVIPSYKHTLLEEAHGVYKLEIYKPSFKDNGRYSCRAENVMAEEEITHNVSFIKPKHFHIRGIQHAHSELMKEKEEAAKRAMEEALKAKEEYEMRRTGKLPPRSRAEPEQPCSQKDRLKFATQLRDRTAIVGNKVKFTVSVIGPDPNIRWFKDGNPIVYGPSIRNSTADGMSILEMTHLTADQTGEYRCQARNDHSEVSTSCYLKIYDAKAAGDKEAPLFVLSMRDVYHTQENDLVIDCKVRGNPRPIIFWQKDELPIEFDERTQQIEHGDGLCELIINKPTTKDSGNYACTATNAIGNQKIVHKVEFTPQPSSRRDSGMPSETASESGKGKADATGAAAGVESGAENSATQAGKGKRPPRPKSEPAPEETMSRRSAGPTFEELQKAARNKLSFVTHLTNRVFAEGSKVKLSCVVQGPDPNVRWLKDENPVVYSPRVKNLSRDGMCALEIDKCTPEDSGDYKLIVRNQDSDISSSCTLEVYAVSQTSDFAPTFTRAPKHTYHLNTNEIYLETRVRGQPMPKVEWVKDGVTIAKEDEKYKQIDHADGTCELIVNFPKPNDSGKYVCKAYNRAGECSVQHTVLFEGKAAHIVDNRHRVYHSDPEHLAKAKSEFPEKAHENGVNEPKPDPEEEEKGKKGRGRGSKGTGSAQNTRTESTPVPEPTPVVTRQKEPPRESKKTIYFASKLSDRVVAEGSKVKLTCYLDGSDPSIRWFKDEQPVVYSPKCRQANTNGVCVLEFTAVAESDSGVYRCYARNTTGEVSTTAKLEVFPNPGSPDSEPTFTRSIKDTYHTQLNEIKLSCHCRGFPTPAITWVKGGVVIEPSEKYQLEDKEDGTCELTINYPNKQDNGKYVLQGENRAGKAEISHLVQLQLKDAPRLPPPHPTASAEAETNGTNGTNGVEDDTNLPPKGGRKKGKGERESVASTTVSDRNWVSRYQETPIDPKTKLHFAAFLTDRTIAEGGKTKLSAYVEGPDPNIRWLKDENPVVLSSNCRSQLRDGLVTLDMAQLKPEDSGVYKLICRNQSGEISCSCKLMVYEVVKEDLVAPLFSVPIKDTYNLNSDELILECRVRGSKPTITWTKNNEFIESNDKYQQFDQADGYCKLIINNPEEKDSGLYSCKAENSMSSDKVTHNVVFNGRDAYILEKTHGYFHRDINKPHFQNSIGDHMITQGGVIALQADILHGPVDVQWYRDHSQIVPGDKVRAFQDHGIHTLIIPDAKYEVSGTYTCVASNAFGKVESVGHVHIVGPSVKGGKCPLFQSRPETEMLIMTGDPFSFSFRLIGEPKPKLIFMKGLKDITQSDRVLKETQDDYIRFTVQRSTPMDSGTYWIVARNEHGTDRAFVTITVKSPKKPKDPNE